MPLEKEKFSFTKTKEAVKSTGEFSDQEKEQKAMLMIEELKELAKTTEIKDDAFYNEIAEKVKQIERIFSPEVIEDIEQQYAFQKEIFLKLGILKETRKKLIITDIEGKEHVFPSLEQIKQSLEKQEHLKQKTEQGFIRLLIVPIGMKLNDLREIYKKQILKHHKEGKLLATKEKETDKDEPLKLKESEPLWTWDEYENADINGKLVYFPEQFDKDNHKGKTKQELIKEQGGFNVILIEDMPNIPAEDKGETMEKRKQLEAGQTPREYLKAIQSDPQYKHEQGMCPEDQLIYAILHLEQTNQVIDDYQGKGKVSYQAGAYFPGSARVPDACWFRGGRRALLGGNFTGIRSGRCGHRPAVKISI